MTDELPPAPPAEDESEGERLFREDESALFDALAGVMEDRGLDEEDLVPMLISIVYHFRSFAYVASTAKPSEAGLKLDLDRLRKLVDEVHRDYRKNAATVVRDLAAALEEGDEPEMVTPETILSNGSGR